MSFQDPVIDLSSSSDSEDLEAGCAPLSRKQQYRREHSWNDSSGDVPPLLERLKKLKSIDLEIRSNSSNNIPSKTTQATIAATSTLTSAASVIRRQPLASSLFHLELSSDDDDYTVTARSSGPSSSSSQRASGGQNLAAIVHYHSSGDTLPDILTTDNVDDAESCISSQASSQQHDHVAARLFEQPHNPRSQVDKSEAELLRAEKKRQRENTKSERERQKLQKRIDRDQLKSSKPGESINYMKAILDVRLLELPEVANITKVLTESNVRYALEDQLVPRSVTWRRETVEKKLAENLQVEQKTSAADEDQALILMATEQFVEAVYHFTQKRMGVTSHGRTLREVVNQFKSLLPGKKITVITSGMQQYFRANTLKQNRAYRAKVINGAGGTTSQKVTKRQKKSASDVGRNVSRVEVEEALVELQIEEPCNVRLLESSLEIAQTIVTFTKAIAEAPFRRGQAANSGFTFYVSSDGVKPVKVDKDGRGLLLLWQRQVQQFNNVSADMAQAIVAEYPSPLALFQTYGQCQNQKECENLLKDIVVRRGAGPLATTRKIGPELSRKIYMFMTSYEGNLILN